MPSDHVIKDERGLRRRRCAARPRWPRPAGWCCSASRPTAPHTGYGYIRRGAPLAGFDGAYRRRRLHREARRGRRPRATSRPATYYWNSGIFVLGARAFLDELARLRARHPGSRRARRSAEAKRGPGLPAPRRAGLRAGARHLGRLCRDGAHRARPPCCRSTSAGAMSAPGRRCGSSAPRDARRQRRAAATRCWRPPRNCYVHSRAGAGRHHRRQGPRHRRHARRAAGGRPRQGAGRLRHRRPPARQARPQGAGAAPPQLPAVGLLRDAQHRRRASRSSCCTSSPAASCPCRCTITAPSTGWWCTAPPR